MDYKAKAQDLRERIFNHAEQGHGGPCLRSGPLDELLEEWLRLNCAPSAPSYPYGHRVAMREWEERERARIFTDGQPVGVATPGVTREELLKPALPGCTHEAPQGTAHLDVLFDPIRNPKAPDPLRVMVTKGPGDRWCRILPDTPGHQGMYAYQTKGGDHVTMFEWASFPRGMPPDPNRSSWVAVARLRLTPTSKGDPRDAWNAIMSGTDLPEITAVDQTGNGNHTYRLVVPAQGVDLKALKKPSAITMEVGSWQGISFIGLEEPIPALPSVGFDKVNDWTPDPTAGSASIAEIAKAIAEGKSVLLPAGVTLTEEFCDGLRKAIIDAQLYGTGVLKSDGAHTHALTPSEFHREMTATELREFRDQYLSDPTPLIDKGAPIEDRPPTTPKEMTRMEIVERMRKQRGFI
jgi:hypothetical protein